MVAFALIGLVPLSWRDAAEAPAPPPADPAAAPARRSPALSAAGAAASSAPAADPQAVAPAREVVELPPPVIERLPEELEPAGPDIVVALDLPPAAWRPPVPAHAHLEESTYESWLPPDALAPQAGDDVQGPQPGDLYWFGPRGLERIRLLGEAPR
jgi:hypothetical protein